MSFTANPLVETAAETNFRQSWLSPGLAAERLQPPASSGFISFTQTLLLCLFAKFHSACTPRSTSGQWPQGTTCMSTLTCTCTTRKSCRLFHVEHRVLHSFCTTIYLVQGICAQVLGFGAEENEVAVEIRATCSLPCPFPQQVSCAICITGACDEE